MGNKRIRYIGRTLSVKDFKTKVVKVFRDYYNSRVEVKETVKIERDE